MPQRPQVADRQRPHCCRDYSVGAWMTVSQLAQYPLAKYTEINRWYSALSSQPGWREAIVPPPL